MTDFETKYRDLVAGLRLLRKAYATIHNDRPGEPGSRERVYFGVSCDLDALLASSPTERPETAKCAWCGGPANGVADLPDGRTFMSCLMPQCDGLNPRKPAASPAEREGTCPKCGDVHVGDGKPQRNCCDWSAYPDGMCDCCLADAAPAPVSSGEVDEHVLKGMVEAAMTDTVQWSCSCGQWGSGRGRAAANGDFQRHLPSPVVTPNPEEG